MKQKDDQYLAPTALQIPLEGNLPLCTSVAGGASLSDLGNNPSYDEFAD